MDEIFEVRRLNDIGYAKIEELAEDFDALLDLIQREIPTGRELSLIRTHLELAYAYVKKGVAKDSTNCVKDFEA